MFQEETLCCQVDTCELMPFGGGSDKVIPDDNAGQNGHEGTDTIGKISFENISTSLLADQKMDVITVDNDNAASLEEEFALARPHNLQGSPPSIRDEDQ